MEWLQFKAMVTDALGLSRDSLHLLSGLGMQAMLVLVFRSWFGALWPIGIIALVAVGNEWFDLTYEIWPDADRGRQWMETVKDLITTLLIPMVLMLLSRLAARRFDRPGTSEGPAPDAAPEVPPAPESL